MVQETAELKPTSRPASAAEELEPHRLTSSAGGGDLDQLGSDRGGGVTRAPARACAGTAPLDLDVLAALVAIELVAAVVAVVAELAAVAMRWLRTWWSPSW
ncbi:MAG TPA: hypothetical protein VF469_09705 [Kofleriaceae bacterium]